MLTKTALNGQFFFIEKFKFNFPSSSFFFPLFIFIPHLAITQMEGLLMFTLKMKLPSILWLKWDEARESNAVVAASKGLLLDALTEVVARVFTSLVLN